MCDDACFYEIFIAPVLGSIKPKSAVKEASNIIVQVQMIGCPCEVNAPTALSVNFNASNLISYHLRFVTDITSSMQIFDEEQISVSLLSNTKHQILLDLPVVATTLQTSINPWKSLSAGVQVLSPEFPI